MNVKGNVKQTNEERIVAHDDGFDDFATSCRHEYAHYVDEMFRDSFDPEVLLRAADEIERLRQERVDWFCVAQQLKDATFQDSMMVELARDHYLRVRGRYEDPRDCM